MLGLKLRSEFIAPTISGTIVSLNSKCPESFVNLPTTKALDVTYPSIHVVQALEACFGASNRSCLVMMAERGQGKVGDEITVGAGADLTPLNSALPKPMLLNNEIMKIWHDDGVGWHHTGSGWIRARVVHVYRPSGAISDVYKICHVDIL